VGNDGGLIECPELEAAFGAPVLVGRHGTLETLHTPRGEMGWEAADSTCLRESEVVQPHNLAAHVDRIPPRLPNHFFHMKGWFTLLQPCLCKKLRKKPRTDSVVFVLEVGRCFVSKRYCQGFRLVNDDDNCDPKSL